MSRLLSLSFLLIAVLGFTNAHAQEPLGVVIHEAGAYEGYNLFSPLDGAGSYLIDNDGRVVHFWDTEYRSNISYLTDDGHLLRATTFGNGGNGHYFGGGAGHGIQEIDWDGNLVWEYLYTSEDYLMHHDIEPLPNGNVLVIAWEGKTQQEAIAAGRDPKLVSDKGIWPLHIIEVEPIRPSGGKVVWEWHIWDHLIQDFDDSKDNYGDVAYHPERVEINPPGLWMDNISDEERAELEALGYLGGDPDEEKKNKAKRNRAQSPDWLHTNAIAYNAKLDQIAVSVLGNNEIWIIDHSTTTDEARGSTGGRSGKGGDLLYRWGNPAAYRADDGDQTLFAQHNVHWIPEGLPGGGHLLIFNNGRAREGGNYTSIVEVATPIDGDGRYTWEAGDVIGPEGPAWEYTAPNKTDFYSMFISGSQRLPNGNTLICYGAKGIFFEVTPEGKTVWRFVNPVKGPKGSSHADTKRATTNIVFRVHRYATDHPAFKDRNLAAGLEVTEFLKENPPRRPLIRVTDEDSN